MANGKINISLKSGFDPRGVSDASRSLDQLRSKLLATNKWMLEINADLSRAIRQYAANSVIDYQREADKGVAHAVLSAKQIEEAWRRAMSQAGAGAKTGFGKIESVARGALKGIGGAFGKIGVMFLQGSVWGAVGMAVEKAFSWVWSKITEDAERAAKRSERAFNESLTSIKDGATAIDKAFDTAMSGIDKAISRFDAMTNSVKELTKAEIELAKQHAIANGMDPAAAQAAASDLSAQVDYEAERARLEKVIELEQKRIAAAKDAEKKTAEVVAKATADKAAAEADLQKKRDEYVARNAQKERAGMMMQSTVGAFWVPGVTAEEARKSREDAALDFAESEEGKKAADKVKQLKDILDGIKTDEKAIAAAEDAQAKITQAQTALDALDARHAARELAVQNEIADKVKQKRKEQAEADKKLADERQKVEIAAAQAAAKERERLDREAHQKRMEDLRKEIAAQKEAASVLTSRASAAQSEFDKAFAMYRDPSRAAAEIGEEKDYRNDLEQLHKDARRYGGKWRIDELSRLMSAGDTQGVSDTLAEWRKSRGFSPQVEAMVRASAAEQAKNSLEDTVKQIEQNTADLAAKLDELLQVKG